MMILPNTFRRLAASVSLAAAGLLAGCDSLMEVDNPEAIYEDDLDNPFATGLLANSAMANFQAMFDSVAYFGAILTDEAVTGHNFETWKQVDLRVLDHTNTVYSGQYSAIHEARFVADSAARRIRTLTPDSSALLAKALVFAGYSYIFGAEALCESPINISEKVYSPDEWFEFAADRLSDAITVASGDYEHLARVGLGRAYLGLGRWTDAIAAVQGVPGDWAFWVKFSENAGREMNFFFGATTGSNRNLGVDAKFRDLNDPRVTHAPTPTRGHNNLTLLWTPFQPPSFAGWTGTENVGFERNTGMRLASGLEAAYITHEATLASAGVTPETIDFVNERRAVGGQPALTAPITVDELRAALMDQRRRDFFLDGHRLGDLRRYKKFYGIDEFPSGVHPNEIWGNYGPGECIPVVNPERIGNPNMKG